MEFMNLFTLSNLNFLQKYIFFFFKFSGVYQQVSMNLINIKGNSSSFGFAIQELPSEEAN